MQKIYRFIYERGLRAPKKELKNRQIDDCRYNKNMKFIKSIIAIIILVMILLELYILLIDNEIFNAGFIKEQKQLNSQDIIPQSIEYPPSPNEKKTGWYFEGSIPALYKDKFDKGVVDEAYFAYYENGEIHPPKKYDVENNYSLQDVERMKRALKIAYRYADINNAFEDGYLINNSFVFAAGMGTHVVNIDHILDDEVSVEKPEFLNYIKNYKTGRLQLVQVGFIAERTTPPKLFDAEEAQGHFHVGNYCYTAKDSIYVNYSVTRIIKNKTDNAIHPTFSQSLNIFNSIENSELKMLDDNCERDGGRTVDSIWMMHFAVNMYNELGMFVDYSYYINYLSSEGITHSFYGKRITF